MAATTNIGSTALHCALRAGKGGPNILRLLLANPAIDPNLVDQVGDTAIVLLLMEGERNMADHLRALVECDRVDLYVRDQDGRSLEELAR